MRRSGESTTTLCQMLRGRWSARASGGPRLLVVVAGLSVGLAAAGCGSSTPDGASATSEASQASAEDGAGPTTIAPVMVPLADGTDFDFNSLRNRDVMLWFWAPW